MDTLEKDKTSELAEQKLAQMEANDKAKAEQKAKEEAKDASTDKSSTENQKTEEQIKAEEKAKADKKTETDTKLLETEDKDLNEEDLAKKQELVKKVEEAKTPEKKLEEWQEKTQKRIDELSGALKAEKEGRKADAQTIEVLESNIANLKGDLEDSGSIESDADRDAKTAEGLHAKMVEEDKDLPREKRREMSNEELEEFLLEDYRAANEWIVERSLRRRDEVSARKQSKEVTTQIDANAKKLYDEFPGCNQEDSVTKLMTEKSMSMGDAVKEVRKENKDFDLMMDIFESDAKFRDPAEGPERVVAEMKKRKETKEETKESYSKEEVEQMKKDAIEEEQKRVAGIDVGLTNSIAVTTAIEGDELYQQGLKFFIAAGKRKGMDWTEQDFKDTKQYGKDNRQGERD